MDQLELIPQQVNWNLELTKILLIKKVQDLKRFCLRELNYFIDNIVQTPFLGTFDDFIHEVNRTQTFRSLENLVLRLINFVDTVFDNLMACGEQRVPKFNHALPSFLNLPTLRTRVNACFVEEILPLFVSDVKLSQHQEIR